MRECTVHYTMESMLKAMRRATYQLRQELLNDGVVDLNSDGLKGWSRDELITAWLQHYGDREIQPSITEQIEAISLDPHMLEQLYRDCLEMESE